MSGVLYYSNSCPHSQKLLQELKKTSLATTFQYICVDQRVKEADGKVKIVLQNGKKVIMPPTLTSIPGLMLLDRNYQILYGDQIYKYLQPKQQQETKQATENNMEPNAFSFEGGGCVVSDNFSFLGQDLEALGDGGLRQMHHYESLNPNLKPQQNLGQTSANDNIKQSNNRIREGEINTGDLAYKRGYNTSAGPGMGQNQGQGF
jgi:hypothetical protein